MEKKTLTKEDYDYWTEFRSGIKNRINNAELKRISKIHSIYFNHKYNEPCTCNPKAIQAYINDINKLYLE